MLGNESAFIFLDNMPDNKDVMFSLKHSTSGDLAAIIAVFQALLFFRSVTIQNI